MSDFKAFDDKLAALLASLSPVSHRQMAAEIAKRLRASQQQRIKRQQAPDGSPFASRKRQPIKGKSGRVKREMFAKMRTARYLKAKGSGDAATVEFAGKVQRVARIHQEGLKDRPNRHSQPVQYAARPLLGFSTADRQVVEDVILSCFSK
jgi:phage virion morphogenesis protein